MPPFTRRRALQGAVGLLAGLAGCNDVGTGPDPPPDGQRSPTPAAREPNDGTADAPEHVALRSTGRLRNRSVLSFARDADAVPTAEGTLAPDDRAHSGLVASRAVAETVSVDGDRLADSTLSASAAAVQEFLDATDFDSQTVYVDHWPVEQCYRLVLCHADWDDREIEIQYGRGIRPYDARCEAGRQVERVTLIRFPVALDPDKHRSHSSGVHGGGCVGGSALGSGDSGAMVATTGGDAPEPTATDGDER